MADNYDLMGQQPEHVRIYLFRKLVNRTRELAQDAESPLDEYTLRLMVECLAETMKLECPPTLKLTQAQTENADQYQDPG